MNRVSGQKIAVIGAGAVGSVIGGLLARAGENVTLITRGKHVEAIKKNGLCVDGALGTFTVKVQAEEELKFKPDLVLLTVKTQDVEVACRQIVPYVTDTSIVTFQNGIRSDDIVTSFLGKENVISGVVLFNASFLNPGHVSYNLKGSLLIGEVYCKNGKRVEEIATILGRAIQTKITDNIFGAHWTKLLVNVMGNSLEAMTGLSLGECMKHPEMRRLGIFILREAFDVVERIGVKLDSLPGLPVDAFRITAKFRSGRIPSETKK